MTISQKPVRRVHLSDGDRYAENRARLADLASAAGASEERVDWIRRLSHPINLRTHGPIRALANLSEVAVLLLERIAEQDARIAALEAQAAPKAAKKAA